MLRKPVGEKNQVERTYDWGQTNSIDEVRGETAKTPSDILTPRQIKSRLTESYRRKREAKVDQGPRKGEYRSRDLGKRSNLANKEKDKTPSIV